MHHLHTTHAYVVGSFPQGESSRVYRLLTERFGLLYVHVQGVRELKNRNRYALTSGARTEVTLVRGREVWRLTSARTLEPCEPTGAVHRRVLELTARLLPVEVPVGELFTLLRGAEAALADSAPHRDVAESLIVARVLRMLGYLSLEAHAPDIASTVQHSPYTREALEQAVVHQSALNTLINRALRAAEL